MQQENDLVIALRQGNQAAYKKLHDQLYQLIFYFASNLIGNKFDANDIATEVFTKVWILRSNFDTFQNLKAFLYLATRNACLNYLEDQARQATRNNKLQQQLSDKEEDLYRPDLMRLESVRSELVEYFYREIKTLPKMTQKIMDLKLKKNMANGAIAAKLGLKEGTVRNRFSAGIRLLREKPGLRKRWAHWKILLRQ